MEGNSAMDAIIGRYKVRMDNNQLILTHSAGISFSLTLEEALGLFNFMSVYQDTLTHKLTDTEPSIEVIHLKKPNDQKEPTF
jgi:hypothetical protein